MKGHLWRMSWRVDRGKYNSRVRLVVYGSIYSGGGGVMKLVMKKCGGLANPTFYTVLKNLHFEIK